MINKIYSIVRDKLIDNDEEALFISNKLIDEINTLDNNTSNANPFIIGFLGKAGSGKSTAQQLLRNMLKNHKKVYMCNFAGTLKNICFNVFKHKLTRSSFFGGQADKLKINQSYYNLSGRKILQIIGTDVVRELYGSNFWIDCCYNKIPDDIEIVILGDVRFSNEVDSIKQRNGIIIKIETPKNDNIITHASENIDNINYDYIIYNDRIYIYKLKNDIEKIMKSIAKFNL